MSIKNCLYFPYILYHTLEEEQTSQEWWPTGKNLETYGHFTSTKGENSKKTQSLLTFIQLSIDSRTGREKNDQNIHQGLRVHEWDAYQLWARFLK